jgi:hypothetical protein
MKVSRRPNLSVPLWFGNLLKDNLEHIQMKVSKCPDLRVLDRIVREITRIFPERGIVVQAPEDGVGSELLANIDENPMPLDVDRAVGVPFRNAHSLPGKEPGHTGPK